MKLEQTRYLKIGELANLLRVSLQTIYRLRSKGLPVVKIGNNVRFDIDSVQKWIDEQNKSVKEHRNG